MTEKEILEQAITKAGKNGYITLFALREAFDSWWEDNKSFHGYYKLIFDHEFAKGFFGGKVLECGCLYEERCGKCDLYSPDYEWEYHLQRMVISDSPIKYMEQYL